MTRSFRDPGSRDVFHDTCSNAASKSCPPELWRVAQRRLDQLNQAEELQDLKAPPANRLEALTRNRAGRHSIRINDPRIHVSFSRINEIINAKRGVTPEPALRLSRLFGTTPEFWLNGQRNGDLWHALHSDTAEDLQTIEPVEV